MKLYVNGLLAASQAIGPKTIYQNLSTLRLSGDDNNKTYFNGLIDEAALYNRALSATEIASIYAAGAAGKCPETVAPFIMVQPSSQTVAAGDSVTFSVLAGGTPPLSYQWQKDGAALNGATTSSLALTSVQMAQSGYYSVTISNQAGTTTSTNALLTVNPAPACVGAPPNLVAWWRAESNAWEQAGNSVSILRPGTSFGLGRSGYAFEFDGTSGSVVVPDASGSLNLTNQLTIEAWVQARTFNGHHSVASKVGGAGGNNGYQFLFTDGTLRGMFNSPGEAWATYQVAYDGPFSAGVWYHIAWTYDQSVLRLYVNGVAVASNSLGAHLIYPSSSTFRISGDDNDNTHFDGLIDELSVYSRALSGGEIASIFAAGAAGKCSASVAPFIVEQPVSQTVIVGTDVTLSVLAGGSAPLAYQWRKDGNNLAGATGASLTLPGIQIAQAGSYSVTISNEFGVLNSSNALLTVNPPPPCTTPPPGLAGWWRAEGDSQDQVGLNHGAVQTGVTFGAGKVGRAYSFDGVNGSVIVPDAPSLRFTSQLTIEAWVNARSFSGDRSIVSKVGGSGGNNGYQLLFSGTTLIGQFNRPGGIWPANRVSYTSACTPGTWYHVAWTYDQAVAKLYIDGQVVASNPIGSIPIATSTSRLRISGDENGQTHFDGLIDEPSVYARALSAEEIAALYAAGVSGKCAVGIPPFVTAHPTNQIVWESNTARLAVTAIGTPPLSYQWYRNGAPLTDATEQTLVLTGVSLDQAGSYNVAVSNSYGVAISSNAILTVNPLPGCLPAPTGLVSWWRAESNAVDQLGIGDGTLMNGTTFGPGLVGNAFSFDGINDYVKIRRSSRFDALSQLTIDFWMKADPRAPIGTKVAGLVTSDFFILETASATKPGINFLISTNGTSWVGTSDANTTGLVFPAGEWHHIAATYDGQKLQLYLDGAPFGSPQPAAGRIAPMRTNSFLAIGSSDGRTVCSQCIGTRYFTGQIDEVDIFDRALTTNEIALLYGAGLSGKCVAPFPPTVLVQPANQTAILGTDVSFSVASGGTFPLSYQWQRNGADIVGATSPTLTLTNVQFAQSGNYAVVITNAAGSITSSNALLTVTFPPAQVRLASVSNIAAGVTVDLPVVLLANGNENAIGFSLSYDPAVVTYAGASLGSGAPGAFLQVNSTQAGNGKLGLAVALAADTTFAAGTQEVVRVSFKAGILTNTTTTSIAFGDQPIGRQLSDPNATVLNANYLGGTFSVTAVEFEGDLAPRPAGDRAVQITDWVLAGRYVARLDYPTNGLEFQRADCAPRESQGDGQITVSDWVQVGRYAAKLDVWAPAGGPTSELAGASIRLSPGRKLDLAPRQVIVTDTALLQGQSTDVSVDLVAQGDENALGFSLAFDPTVLRYAGAQLGTAGNGATLYANATQANAGRVGFALALSTGRAFAAGTSEVVKISFQATPTAAGKYPISLVDQPVRREISDPNAEVLSAAYTGGILVVREPPALTIARTADGIRLSWPAWATSFVLQSADAAGQAPADWSNLQVTPEIKDDQSTVTLPVQATTRFYRLFHP